MSTKTYFLNRLAQTVATVFVVLTIVFGVVRAIPGDPVKVIAPNANADQIAAIREQLGLGKPFHEAYVEWLSGVLQGDFGTSLIQSEPVLDIVLGESQATVSIAVVGMTIALLIGISGGIISAMNQYKWKDNVVTVLSFVGISMPAFWVGILLILIFAVNIDFIPGFSYVPIQEGFVPWFSHIILPSLAVGIPYGGIILRFMRSAMLDVLNKQYMMTAHSKGLSPRLVLYKHGFQNALIPVITMAGIIFAIALAGIVAVEIVFGINGFGRVLIQSIQRRDYPLIQGIVLIFATIYVTMMFAVDMIYAMVNPKIRFGG
jgi:peptide/nickel transport system permease protein